MRNVVSLLPTPNPNAYKFVVDRPLLKSGSRNYTSADACGDDSLGKAIFSVAGVTNVFYLNDFLTVSATDDADWTKIFETVKEVLREHDSPDDASAAGGGQAKSEESSKKFEEMNDEERLELIESVLDRFVRPSLAGDGGGVIVRGIREFQVGIHYQGACGSCPSATAGTLHAIQRMIQDRIDPRLTVVMA